MTPPRPAAEPGPATELRRVTETRRVRNRSVELAVFESGPSDGETIVLVHGWPDTHALWTHVVPLLEENYRVVTYDSRGAGASTVPGRTEDYKLGHLAADLFAVIDAVSPDRPVHVVGHDWGSVEGWEAVCEPDAARRIASFTSVSGPNLDLLGAWARENLVRGRLRGPLAQAVASAYTVLFQVPRLADIPLRTWFAKHWPAFLRFFDGLDPADVRTGPTLASDMVAGLQLYRANIRDGLLRPRRRRTDVPVQLVLNLRDRAVRPVGYADYERYAPNLSRTTLRSGHWAPFSHPGELATAVARFVDTHAAPATSSSEVSG
ncbi:alpha/beta fold hydrolase [Rhodococcus sp. HNM0569]|uniref:alpha/beta fold hydrolase n=1 Tax=Rhodococcus sp. HNM0569 TaxID=2716340 RepID=UPI00146DE80A|nr:alpha/beta fold hydrolase [Rhodococcus sp. HNM0569]NLU84474.1 alpha/beta fold hydrolase [Rhodococcus sp. HNM0569]